LKTRKGPDFFRAPRTHMARATAGVAILLALARLTGFARSQVMASLFGAGAEMDAYIVARSLAMLATAFTGPISVTFMTMYAYRMARGEGRTASSLAGAIVSLTCAIMTCQVIVLLVMAPQMTRLMAPGFSDEVYSRAIVQARLLVPFMFFPLLGALSKSILNTHKDFATPVVADVLEHLTVIALIVTLSYQYRADALAISAIAGWVVLFGIQWFVLKRRCLWPSPSLCFDTDVSRVVALALPYMGGSLLGGVHHLVDRALASRLPEGCVAMLEYAERLRGVPVGILVAAATTVLFPSLSEMWGKRSTGGFSNTIESALRSIEFVCIPAAAGLMVLAGPITRLAFQRGAFTDAATRGTTAALVAYGPGLVAIAALQIMNAGFVSAHKTGIPVLLGMCISIANIGLDFVLVESLGHVGLALANSTAAFLGMVVGMYCLKRVFKGVSLVRLRDSIGKVLVSSMVMAAVVLKLSEATGLREGTGSIQRDVLTMLAVTALGVVVYLIMSFAVELSGGNKSG
jgi:putative peptidoglycan lipid II flippase